MTPTFLKLNHGWNAEPNAPYPEVWVDGKDVLLSFLVNPFQYPDFKEGDHGVLRFQHCERYRLGSMNDEGWHRGECRYSKAAPAWGEFYLLQDAFDPLDTHEDWHEIGEETAARRHFLFYFRDNDFECLAKRCLIEPLETNALNKLGKTLLPLP